MSDITMTVQQCREQSEMLMNLANNLEDQGDLVGAALNRQLAEIYLKCAESGLYLDGTPLSAELQK